MSLKGKRNALGRGLGALLEDTPGANSEQTERHEVGGISEVALNGIEVNPFQPRTDFDKEALAELAESIKTQGIIQPITLRMIDQGRFQIISGERRVQASRMIGLETVPAFIRQANDQEMLELALIENIQREDLNSIEIALTYQRLISECGLKQEQLGARVGKNRSTVNNYIRLLKLPPDIQAALRDKRISMGHARAIINIDNVELQLTIFKKILSDDLSVRKVEKLVRDLVAGNTGRQAPKLDPERQYHIQRLQQKLTAHFGAKVVVKSNAENRGDIRIPFLSAEDFNRIMDLLQINPS